MTTLAATVSKLQAVGASDSTQVIFVSIDPNRDTISHMETYVKYFDTAFIGATGEIEEINVLSSQLGVAHIRSEPNEEGIYTCLLYTSPSPRDATLSRMPSSA